MIETIEGLPEGTLGFAFFDVAHSAQAELWIQGDGEPAREAGIRQPQDA